MAKPKPPGPRKRHAASLATQGVYDALVARGINSVQAQRIAAGLLQRPGVKLTLGGMIEWKGKRYSPENFAATPLAKLLSGETAAAYNTAAITGDPGYLQAKAQLDMERQQNLAALDQQRTRGILDYGSGAYTKDPTLAAQAEANPFSISKLMALQYQRAQQSVNTAANRAGTLFGGGVTSGLSEAERVNAQQRSDAVRSLTDLLSNLGMQEGAQNQGYNLGISQATLDAQQRLLSAGLLHAATTPAYNPNGHFNYYQPPNKKKKGGGGGSGFPPPPKPPPRRGGGGRVPPRPGRRPPPPPLY